jgi:ABC-2 type transport system ATP-binding protein
MWQIVHDLVATGVTIFLTTQYLEEADQLASQIALLDHGRLIAEGSAAELKRLVPGGHVVLRFEDAAAIASALGALPAGTADYDALTLQVPSDGSIASLRSLLARLDESGTEIAELSVHTPDLDDVFLTLTGRSAQEAQASA